MKKIFITLLISLTSFSSWSFECSHTEGKNGGRIYLAPVYMTDSTYIINNKTKKILAKIYWKLDQIATLECEKKLKAKFGENKVVISKLKVDEVIVNFPGEVNAYLRFMQESNGHLSGYSGLVNLDYASKAEILESAKFGPRTASLKGSVQFSSLEYHRDVAMKMDCIGEKREQGVFGLMSRLGEIKERLTTVNSIEPEFVKEALETFLGTCVKFTAVNADSLTEFEQNQRTVAKIKMGSFPVYRFSPRLTYQDFLLIPFEETNIIEVNE